MNWGDFSMIKAIIGEKNGKDIFYVIFKNMLLAELF